MVRRQSKPELAPFQRDKLFVSVYESCRHRSSATQDASALTQTIIDALMPAVKDGTIPQDRISTTTLEVLRRFDPVAATFYGAYHPARKA